MPPKKISTKEYVIHLINITPVVAPTNKANTISSKHSIRGLEDWNAKNEILALKVSSNSIIQWLNLITISIIITLLRLISNESDGQYEIYL
jgi:hypothetical protein